MSTTNETKGQKKKPLVTKRIDQHRKFSAVCMSGKLEPEGKWGSGHILWIKADDGRIYFYYDGHISNGEENPNPFASHELVHFKNQLKLADASVYNGYNDDFGFHTFSVTK